MSLHDPETGEIIEPLDVARLIGTDGEFGAVAILRDGRSIALRIGLGKAMKAIGLAPDARYPVRSGAGLQKRKSMP
jgi:hypothetical protein